MIDVQDEQYLVLRRQGGSIHQLLPHHAVNNASMESAEALNSKQNGKNATVEDLIEYTKRALEESAEKQRAIASSFAELPPGYVHTPGDTLDLSSKGARKLPIEVIELIKDRVER